MSEDEGKMLVQSCSEWAEELRWEREAFGEDWQEVTLQLRSFPDELPKVPGERNLMEIPKYTRGTQGATLDFSNQGARDPWHTVRRDGNGCQRHVE